MKHPAAGLERQPRYQQGPVKLEVLVRLGALEGE
jgi:hypothetical protein